jgi:hypothetical protein
MYRDLNKNNILVEKKNFYDIDSFFIFLDDNEILFELGDLPEKYFWCHAPFNSIDVIINIYHKDNKDILLLSYPCYGDYRIINNLLNEIDETKILEKNKYVIPIIPCNLYDSIFNEMKDKNTKDLAFSVFIYKKIKKEILCWYGNADKKLLEYVNDDLIKLSIIPKNNKIIIDTDVIIYL